ncbi:unnamed protein product [Closterium sp. NIES-65]|nr:unnamed protein product [Closterium sp. NIES-65]
MASPSVPGAGSQPSDLESGPPPIVLPANAALRSPPLPPRSATVGGRPPLPPASSESVSEGPSAAASPVRGGRYPAAAYTPRPSASYSPPTSGGTGYSTRPAPTPRAILLQRSRSGVLIGARSFGGTQLPWEPPKRKPPHHTAEVGASDAVAQSLDYELAESEEARRRTGWGQVGAPAAHRLICCVTDRFPPVRRVGGGGAVDRLGLWKAIAYTAANWAGGIGGSAGGGQAGTGGGDDRVHGGQVGAPGAHRVHFGQSPLASLSPYLLPSSSLLPLSLFPPPRLEESEEARAADKLGLGEAMEYTAAKWVLVLLIGCMTGGAAFLINMVVENAMGVKLALTIELLNGGSPFLAVLVYSLLSALLVAASAALCVFVAPAAAGSGIPEVRAYLNGVDMPQVLSPLTLLVKVGQCLVNSLVSVSQWLVNASQCLVIMSHANRTHSVANSLTASHPSSRTPLSLLQILGSMWAEEGGLALDLGQHGGGSGRASPGMGAEAGGLALGKEGPLVHIGVTLDMGAEAGGLALGKEGPLVHIGAAIAALFGRGSIRDWLARRAAAGTSGGGDASGGGGPDGKKEAPLRAAAAAAGTGGVSEPLLAQGTTETSTARGGAGGGRGKEGERRQWWLLYSDWLRFFDNDRARHDLVTIGAGAGVAAAFQCPLGGILFALEELTSWWKKKVVWKALFTNAVGAIALRALMAACEGGRCGLYSDGGFILFDAQRESDFGLRELLPVLVLGITGGLVGALFNTAVTRLAKLRAKYINPYGPWCKVLEAALIAILTSLARMALPFASRCLPCPENEVCPDPSLNGNYIAFTCPAGSYNPMAGLAPTTNDNAITNLFSSSPAQYTHATLAIFFLVFFSLAIITNGCSVPAGLFVPLIVAGGTYGRMMGKLMRSLTSSTSPTLSSFLLPSLTSPLRSAGLLLFGESGSDTGLDEGTYALLGAASLLGGSMRMSVSLSVMLLEVTGNLLLLPLIMLATTIAKEVGDCFNEGVVDEASHLKRLPMLEYPPPEFMKNLTAIDGVRGPAVALKSVERVGEVLRVLQTTTHSAFPVVQIVATREGGKLGEGEKEGVGEGEGEGEVQAVLYGMVLRSKLLKLLADKSAFQRGTLCTARTNPLHKLPLSTNTAAAAAAAAVPERRAGQRTVRFEGVPVSPQATNGDTPRGTAEGAYAEGLTLGGRLAKSLSHKHRTATAIVNVKKTPCIEDIDLSVEEQDMFLDLHPFCNTSPHVVGEAMSLRKAYAIFRRMGLRHLCVVRERMQVVGVLTRKDLLPHSFEKQQLEEWDDDDSDSDSSDVDEEEEGSVGESGGFARENGGAGVSGGGEGGAAIVDRAVVAVASDGDESGRRGSGHVSDGEGGGRLGSGHASDGEGGVRGTPKRRKRAIPSFISRCHTQKYH